MIGDIYKTVGGECVVIKEDGCMKITVKFLDDYGYETTVQINSLRIGAVKNKGLRSIQGVGYMGSGKYKSSKKGVLTKEYKKYATMMCRGYCEKFKRRNPSYANSSVHPDWHNFQNFAEWINASPFKDLGYILDKDILVEGNKIYSPETCCLVPHEINSLFYKDVGSGGRFSKGVYYEKDRRKYVAKLKTSEKCHYLGRYETENEAFLAYKAAKECHVKAVAKKWRGGIDDKVYEALMNWEINA